MLEQILEKWQEILSFVKEDYDISEVSYNTWITPLKPEKLEKEKDGVSYLYFCVSEDEPAMYISVVNKKYAKLIEVGIEEVTGIKCTLKLYTKSDEADTSSSNKMINQYNKPIPTSTLTNANLNPMYTFDTFVVGKNNNIAHAASLAVAESPGEIYNPLFIYGGVGLGKTHLMHSIAHFILEKNPNANILYVTSETFTNELIEAIKNKNSYSTTEFRNKYRNIDVLLIDDIQFIIGKESTQEEFFHTFNTLYENKKQIIISSDRPPKDFTILEERLRSRFECGLSVDIQPPDFETRMAILRKKEEMDNINIDNEVMLYIANNVKSNIRELEGALTKVVALGKLGKKEVDQSVAQEALKDLISSDAPPQITPDFIIDVVCEHFSISKEDLIGSKRNREIVYPRQIVMYLCRNLTDVPLQKIGEILGGKDHSTVLHGTEKITEDLKKNEELRSTIEVIRKKLNPQ